MTSPSAASSARAADAAASASAPSTETRRTPSTRRFRQVDVFGADAFAGNPLAVVVDADGLSDEQMQRIASWTNLSETSFLLAPTRPGADYRVRIFTPSTELDFAGHPTLGSAFAWLAAQADGGEATGSADERILVQECRAGLVEVRVDGDDLAFAAPPLVRSGPMDADHLADAAAALGIDPADVLDHAWVDNGAGWCVLELASAQDVLDLEPDLAVIPGRKIGALGAVGATADAPTTGADGPAYEVRGFVAPDPVSGTPGYEDPVTGSLNAGIAQWMLERGRFAPPWTVRQGTRLGRHGRVLVDVDAEGTIWIGGTVRTGIQGEILV
ncbi:PhzF family phenazine biosynthesis protein [Brachybacterium sp. MASK1Z-5]|uniref:PhzF family phenazine biosynthesis protein n=1 Tax=Brachybacterium halotolerans TaxID=2795215 RepID=A0ABS1BDW2_9MICO|nr:PhzF family phenazine biosynthesis protein [Brachybacterium halotolerans]MBK0332337.1 PhzF family phenazine biosynthesis protein [Brachybacterium halotolerans]